MFYECMVNRGNVAMRDLESKNDKEILMKRSVLTHLFVCAVIVLFATTAWTAMLVGTTGRGETLSTLVEIEIDPDDGTTIRTIGPVGYVVNGLEYDATTGRLYGSTSVKDPIYNGLIEIDINTGAGTDIGVDGWGLSVIPIAVTNITIDSTGRMYGWWDQKQDDLVSIDKATGIATRVGESSVVTLVNGLDFDNSDTLYMIQLGYVYQVDVTTGSATFTGSYGECCAHHGDFDPANNLYYAIGPNKFGPKFLELVDISDPASPAVVGTVPLEADIHVLTFVNQPPVAQCRDVTELADENWLADASVDNGSFDPDGDDITLEQDPPGPYQLGDTDVELIVTDDFGDSDSCAATVKVVDDTPPTATAELVPLAGSSDGDSDSDSDSDSDRDSQNLYEVVVSCYDNGAADPTLTAILSVGDSGGGKCSPDWNVVTNGDIVKLKLAKNTTVTCNNDGSLEMIEAPEITLTATCTDASGNEDTAEDTLTLPPKNDNDSDSDSD